MQESKTKIIKLPPKGYTPRKSDLAEEFDMPGLSEEQVRQAFLSKVELEKPE